MKKAILASILIAISGGAFSNCKVTMPKNLKHIDGNQYAVEVHTYRMFVPFSRRMYLAKCTAGEDGSMSCTPGKSAYFQYGKRVK